MNDKIYLKGLFESNRIELVDKLQGLFLPYDSQKIQLIVSEYFNHMFSEDGDYRQQLTYSEDYILQAVISVLNAQREMMSTGMDITYFVGDASETIENVNDTMKESFADKYAGSSSAGALVGAGVGALTGNLALGGWGAVFGALAGTAVAIYITSGNSNINSKHKTLDIPKEQKSFPLDTNAFLNTVSAICTSIDNLLDTFRAQINNVIQKYESQSKPTLDSDYRPLLESIQTLVGYVRTHSDKEEKYVRKMKERVEDVSEILETWNLELVDYDGNNSVFFDKISSDKATEDRMVYPAIVNGSSLILKGKIFIPA